MDIDNFKQALRSTMKKRRQELTLDEREQASRLIARALNELDSIKRAGTIMAYSAIQNEVDLGIFLEEQQRSGKKILLPRVEGDEMIAVEWQGWQETARSSFGIAEPTGLAYPLQEIDVVLIPGLVFDGNGYRLGYGRGYYDRFLLHLRKDAFKCGVCYEFQVVDNVSPHEGDIPMHWIVTEQSELLIDGDFF